PRRGVRRGAVTRNPGYRGLDFACGRGGRRPGARTRLYRGLEPLRYPRDQGRLPTDDVALPPGPRGRRPADAGALPPDRPGDQLGLRLFAQIRRGALIFPPFGLQKRGWNEGEGHNGGRYTSDRTLVADRGAGDRELAGADADDAVPGAEPPPRLVGAASAGRVACRDPRLAAPGRCGSRKVPARAGDPWGSGGSAGRNRAREANGYSRGRSLRLPSCLRLHTIASGPGVARRNNPRAWNSRACGPRSHCWRWQYPVRVDSPGALHQSERSQPRRRIDPSCDGRVAGVPWTARSHTIRANRIGMACEDRETIVGRLSAALRPRPG